MSLGSKIIESINERHNIKCAFYNAKQHIKYAKYCEKETRGNAPKDIKEGFKTLMQMSIDKAKIELKSISELCIKYHDLHGEEYNNLLKAIN